MDLLGEIDLLGNGEAEATSSTAVMELPQSSNPTKNAGPTRPSIAAQSQTQSSLRQTKSQLRGLFFFDLETIPDYDRMDQFGLDPLPVMPPVDGPESLMSPTEFVSQELKAFSAWLAKHNPPQEWLNQVLEAEKGTSKPRKGALEALDDHAKRIQAIANAEANRRKEMSCSPEMCRIVAMGWAFAGEEPQSMIVNEETTEAQILEAFWAMAKNATRTIGFNILSFDLPVIFIRSILLGVEPSRLFDLKPWGNDCTDLMALRFPKGSPRRFKWLANAMGIEVPAGDIEGSQVEELWRQDPALVGAYVRSDVKLLQVLHGMYRGFFC